MIERTQYRLIGTNDISGFLALMFDNVAVLSFMSGILIIGFGFPAEIVYTRMFPGTTFGVFVGDLVYTLLAVRLARRSNKDDVTAMPLGLDTPSTIGIALAVLGPAFIAAKQDGYSPTDAALLSWYIGMATMVMIGIVKTVLSFWGEWIRKAVPEAGLLGSIAGVGLALIGCIPLVDTFGMPLVGMISLTLVLYSVVAGYGLPGRIPGVLAAIVLGTAAYYFLRITGLTVVSPEAAGEFSRFTMGVHFPVPTLDFLQGIGPALKYLPITVPFALLTIVGGINVTESARAAGDDYNARDILLTEALATLIAGVCGGVAQSCPYIGHPAYKRMGSRAGYTLLTGIFFGLGGILGYISFLVELIPRAVLAPVMVFVGLEITAQAFIHSPRNHAAAVALAMFPSVARLVSIQIENPEIVPTAHLHDLISKTGEALPEILVIIALGNGFILTGMLWGAFLAEMMNRRLKASAFYLVILSIASFFGIIHSTMPQADIYLPWMLDGNARTAAYQFSASYLVSAGIIWLLSYSESARSTGPAIGD